MAIYKSLDDERHESIHRLLSILYYEWLALYSGQASKGLGYIWRYYDFFAGYYLVATVMCIVRGPMERYLLLLWFCRYIFEFVANMSSSSPRAKLGIDAADTVQRHDID